MSIEKVKEYLKQYNKDKDVIVLQESTATVDLAAKALNVIPARIAKTLSFKVNGQYILVIAAGDTKIDNKRYKQYFGIKAKMLSPEEVINQIGHKIGGVCPFAVNKNVKVYCDISLQRFFSVFPACGSANSAIELSCDELFSISNAVDWIDICKINE